MLCLILFLPGSEGTWSRLSYTAWRDKGCSPVGVLINGVRADTPPVCEDPLLFGRMFPIAVLLDLFFFGRLELHLRDYYETQGLRPILHSALDQGVRRDTPSMCEDDALSPAFFFYWCDA